MTVGKTAPYRAPLRTYWTGSLSLEFPTDACAPQNAPRPVPANVRSNDASDMSTLLMVKKSLEIFLDFLMIDVNTNF
jgi:hypothetical protein